MDVGAEKVNPYAGDTRQKGEQVREMFDNIAPAYDFMNRAMTMGIDTLWRRKAVNILRKHLGDKPATILDVATGTGDLAILMAKKLPHAQITGIDLSEGMVEIGRQKVAAVSLTSRISLGIADCLDLPFPDGVFDCVTVAYGVRNFQRLLDGYREMARVLKPGGLLCVIELSTPTSPVVLPLYKFYTRKAIPLVGKLVSKDTHAYAYLPESIAAVPQGSKMAALIEEAGLSNAQYLPLTFGVCTIYTAVK